MLKRDFEFLLKPPINEKKKNEQESNNLNNSKEVNSDLSSMGSFGPKQI